ncbi:MAG: hypothetical protein ABI377_02950 [Devosia sp.]
MNTTKGLLGGMALLCGFALAAPAWAAAPAMNPMSITKECSKFTGHAGDFCTITKSSVAAIPVGAKVFYYGPSLGPTLLSSTVLIDAGNGTTAIGYCNVDLPKASGVCSFWAGSGALAGVQALLTLTIDSTGLFHWDGGYTVPAM